MGIKGSTFSAKRESPGSLLNKIRGQFAQVPLLGWLFGVLIAVAVEYLAGHPLAQALGLASIPPLFGVTIILKEPALIPSAMLYVLLVYVLPAGAVAWLSSSLANRLAAKLLRLPLLLSAVIHLGLLYAALHVWAGLNDYRLLVLRLTLIAIMLTLSLNVVNGYMGEFSCSHPGF
ncbi:MAG: branched-chain amino acid ABC transporter permease, partial [Anaerolineae bacterium]